MTYIHAKTIALSLLALSVPAWAGTSATAPEQPQSESPSTAPATAPEQPQSNFPLAEQVSGSALKKQLNQYLDAHGWVLGQNVRDDGSEFYLVWNAAPIQAKPSDMNYEDARVAAFERAVLGAKGEFVKMQQQIITAKTLSELSADDRNFDPASRKGNIGQMQVLGQKVTALTEGALDKLLKKLDVDPSQFSERKKRVLARQALTKQIATNAVASVVGMRPLSSFEDASSIGVLMVYSKAQQALADAIREGRAMNNPAKAGHSTIQQIISAQLKKDSDYLYQHGVRLIYDNQGTPWLVAFGQSGVKATNQTSRLKLNMMIRGNRQAAASFARAQLAEFLQGTVSFSASTNFLSEAEVARITKGDMISEEQTSNLGKLIQTKIRQQAKVKMPGIIVLRKWTANDPDSGHLVVGEAIAWSPKTAASAKQLSTRTVPASRGTGGGSAKLAPKTEPHASADFETPPSF